MGLSETRTGLDAVALFEGGEVLVVEKVLRRGGPRHTFERRSSSQSRNVRGVEQLHGRRGEILEGI